MKRFIIASLLSLHLLGLSLPMAQALEISLTRSLTITDDDSTLNGDAGYDSTPPVIGTTFAMLDTSGGNAQLGYRFTGYNSGRGVSNGSQQVESITQSIDVTVTWTLTASNPGEVYSFTLNPELHAYLNILDDSNDESGDVVTVSNFSASLQRNGSTVSDSLDLTGGSRTTVGSSNINDINNSQTFTNLTGDNEFVLRYTGSTTAAWKIAGIQNNRTANAVLWGQDGTMSGDSFPDTFDNYSQAADRDADGLFVQATAELVVIPEMSSLMLSSLCLGGALFCWLRRIRRQEG